MLLLIIISVDIIWRKSERRGEIAGYSARTHLLNNRDAESQEDYVFNVLLHDMIKNYPSPYNDSIELVE